MNNDVRENFRTTFERLKITKPQLVVWYLMAQGVTRINEILSMTEVQRDTTVSEMIIKLNKEYGRHNPIQ